MSAGPLVRPPAPAADWESEEVSRETAVERLDTEAASPLGGATANANELDTTFQDAEVSNSESMPDPNPWFHKHPVSESQFVDSPAVVSPEEPTPWSGN